MASSAPAIGQRPGSSSRNLRLTDLGGIHTSIQAFRGKLPVFNVRATWCPPCRREMPGLERLSKNVDGRRIVAVSIAIGKDANAVREFLTQNGITYLTS